MPEHDPLNYEPSETVDDRFEKMLAVARNVIRVGVVILGVGFIGSLIAFGAWVQADRESTMRQNAKRVIWLGIAVGIANALVTISLMTLCAINLNSRMARVHCSAHLRSIGLSIRMYANDSAGEQLPRDFATVIATQDITTAVFICPGSSDVPANLPATATAAQRAASVVEGTSTCSYLYRAPLDVPASQLTARHVIAYEKPGHHDGGIHILFGDWHAQWVPQGTYEQIIAEVEAGQNPPPSVK